MSAGRGAELDTPASHYQCTSNALGLRWGEYSSPLLHTSNALPFQASSVPLVLSSLTWHLGWLPRRLPRWWVSPGQPQFAGTLIDLASLPAGEDSPAARTQAKDRVLTTLFSMALVVLIGYTYGTPRLPFSPCILLL